MDFIGIPRGSIRLKSLEKLACNSFKKTGLPSRQERPTANFFNTLLASTRTASLSEKPISHNEIEILIALCKSSEFTKDLTQAETLLSIFETYLLEATNQKYLSKVSFKTLYPTPWTKLTYELVVGVSNIGISFPSLKEKSCFILRQYVDFFTGPVDLSSYFSLVGFLQGLTKNVSIVTPNLLESIVDNLNDNFYSTVESTISSISDVMDVDMVTSFEDYGYELSSLFFMFLLNKLAIEYFKNIIGAPSDKSLIGFVLASNYRNSLTEEQRETVKCFTNFSTQCSLYINQGSDRLVTSTFGRRNTCYSIKATVLDIYSFGYITSAFDSAFAIGLVNSYLEQIYKNTEGNGSEAVEMANSELLPSVFSSAALLSRKDNVVGLRLNRCFPSVLCLPLLDTDVVKRLARFLSYSLNDLSPDEVISSIYGLTNILSELREQKKQNVSQIVGLRPSFSISENNYASTIHTDDGSIAVETQPLVFKNVITAVLEVAKNVNDESINILVVTILSQKIMKKPGELNFFLLEGLIEFVDVMEKREFLIVVRYFFDLSSFPTKDPETVNHFTSLWVRFSSAVKKRSSQELYTVYLHELLSAIITKGDIEDLEHHRSNNDVSLSASQIVMYLKPLAYLLPPVDEPPRIPTNKETVGLFKDAWFNLCIHGFSYGSDLAEANRYSLLRIAHNSPALASESSWNRTETSIEMNTILRRGTSKHTEKLHKDILGSIFTTKLIDAKMFESQISRPKLMFLASNLLVESLRAESGDCSTSLEYLSDPSVAIAGLQDFMGSIAFYVTSLYVKRIQLGGSSSFTIPKITEQLKKVFISCCHRDFSLQNTAFQCADLMITRCPPISCHEASLFALLEILALMFQSVVDADTNEYDPNTVFKSELMDITLLLSDNYKWRHSTLDKLTTSAKKWIYQGMMRSEQDMKSLLQSYISRVELTSPSKVNFGVSFALEMGGKILPVNRELYSLEGSASSKISTTVSFLSQFPWRNSMRTDLVSKLAEFHSSSSGSLYDLLRSQVEALKHKLLAQEKIPFATLAAVLRDLCSLIVMSEDCAGDLISDIVSIPFIRFTPEDIELGISLWLAIMKEKPDYSSLVLSEILSNFEQTVKLQKGLYSQKFDINDSRYNTMEYLPTSKEKIDHMGLVASNQIKPHLLLIRFFTSHFEASKFQSDHVLKMFTRTTLIALMSLSHASLHPFARLTRFELICFALNVLKVHRSLKTRDVSSLTSAVFDGALSWFTERHKTPFGNNKLKMRADFSVLTTVARTFGEFKYSDNSIYEHKRIVLLLLLDHEISFLASWLNPLNPMDTTGRYCPHKLDETILKQAFYINGKLALHLVDRYKAFSLEKTLRSLVSAHPFSVIDDPNSMKYLISEKPSSSSNVIVLWSIASPIDSINLFLPPYNKDPLILQYTMRSLESFDAHLTFFYVPQIVQALRYDSRLGYVRRFILKTANVSQLFAHQIIWNMAANSFKDEESTMPDDIKPVLDDIRDNMVKSFSVADRVYYEKEFSFFGEVTGISGKLKPYIKKSKPEKKAKIDEEMASIVVEEGVYLPSNPDGRVVDINRKSGRPLQSHAKAPFMATFKIEKEVLAINGEEEQLETVTQDLSAIFKVGDDCRQDVLALQLISIFRTIWTDAGLDVFVFPNRVIATAPGCGIIDVLPKSISRDMLGREAVNGLYEYFISQYGPESGPQFQKARNNFIKSLAAYSIVTYLLEIKDRHNGNIMYDSDGHILHIDFGFCFDIVPGGVKFEQSPFKLTREMVSVMGGSVNTQAYKWFEELCVKSFLACRPYMDTIIKAVIPMLDSGLPCFKPATIKHLTARFVPQKNDKEAAKYIRGLIKKSFESLATGVYDEFQRITNGIPY